MFSAILVNAQTGNLFLDNPINVLSFSGVKGDSATDCTLGIQAAFNAAPNGATVYFPMGAYKITAPINITTSVHVLGSIGTVTQFPTASYCGSVLGASKVFINSSTINLFNVKAPGCLFENIVLQNVNTSATAGDLLHCNYSGLKVFKCGFIGAYNGIVQKTATESSVAESFFVNLVNHDISMQDTVGSEDGDNLIHDNWFYGGGAFVNMSNITHVMIYINGCAGEKIHHNKFNQSALIAIQVYDSAETSSDIEIDQNSIEITNANYAIYATATPLFDVSWIIDNNQIKMFSSAENGIKMSQVSGTASGNVIEGYIGGSTGTGVQCPSFTWLGNTITGFSPNIQNSGVGATTQVNNSVTPLPIYIQQPNVYESLFKGNLGMQITNTSNTGYASVGLTAGPNSANISVFGTSWGYPGGSYYNNKTFIGSTTDLVIVPGGTGSLKTIIDADGYGGSNAGNRVVCDSSGTTIGRNNYATLANRTLYLFDNSATNGKTKVTIQGGNATSQSTTDTLMNIYNGSNLNAFSILGSGVINVQGLTGPVTGTGDSALYWNPSTKNIEYGTRASGGGGGPTLYTGNGTITGNRVVTMGGNTLAFNGLLSSINATGILTKENDSVTRQIAIGSGLSTSSGTLNTIGLLYTPSFTNTTNISASTVAQSSYTRNGNIITVMVSGLLTPTLISTGSVITFSLPITSSNVGSQGNTGNGVVVGATGNAAGIVAIPTASTGTLSFFSLGTSSTSFSAIFQYSL